MSLLIAIYLFLNFSECLFHWSQLLAFHVDLYRQQLHFTTIWVMLFIKVLFNWQLILFKVLQVPYFALQFSYCALSIPMHYFTYRKWPRISLLNSSHQQEVLRLHNLYIRCCNYYTFVVLRHINLLSRVPFCPTLVLYDLRFLNR